MLDKKLKANWLTALRSREYTQIQGNLKDEKGYCCIGVFAHCNNIPISRDGRVMLDEDGIEISYSPLTELIGQLEAENLWKMNDRENKSFSEIADYIEANL